MGIGVVGLFRDGRVVIAAPNPAATTDDSKNITANINHNTNFFMIIASFVYKAPRTKRGECSSVRYFQILPLRILLAAVAVMVAVYNVSVHLNPNISIINIAA